MNRRQSAGRGVPLVAMLGLAAGLLGAPGAVAAEPAPAAQVTWKTCPEDVVLAAVPTQLDCAIVPVPLDYADAGGTQIDIMISRLASRNPAKRRGVLLLNQGGPGGSGLAFSALLDRRGIPATVLDSYDLIGMDTRGVGHSTRMSCGFTAEGPYWANIPPYAPDDAAVAAQAEIAKGVAERCAVNGGDRLRHLSTANMARDLDRIRTALGEEKASFLGYSYGSALGAAYASMFPERADRVVLDSNVGDTHLNREGLRRFALGMEQTFPDFAKWVANRHDSYGLGRTPAQVRKNYLETAQRLDETPVHGYDGAVFRYLIFGSAYGKSLYGKAAQVWQALRAGVEPPSGLAASLETPSPNDNALTVFLAVTCNDVEWPEDIPTYQRAAAQDREKFPLFGGASANIVPCAFWSHEPAEAPVAVDDDGPANVLVVQNQRDPVTPLRGGELIDEKFGDRSRLVSVDASGHGVYVLGDNACALMVGTAYLVDGTMPRRDITCPANRD